MEGRMKGRMNGERGREGPIDKNSWTG